MPDTRPILTLTGILLSVLSLGMIFPLLADIYMGHENWRVFFLCMVLTAFLGGTLLLGNTGTPLTKPTYRQAFLMTVLSWITLSVFSALPFHLSTLEMSFTDSFFEAVSGITTTGSTVITGLDTAPPGILIWRAILQWLGGIGIIIMALSVLPFLNIGGMQIFKTQGADDKQFIPRAMSLGLSISLIYFALTLCAALAYFMGGMGKFDALAHAMTTISTGGFSTHDDSLGYFENSRLKHISIFFMILGSLPFILYLRAFKGHITPLLKDSQVHWFLAILLLSITACALYLMIQYGQDAQEALDSAIFSITSLMTGTGFVSENYNLWGGFPIALLFFLMATGACAGSTSCAIKIFRFQILAAIVKVQIQKLLHPSGIFIAHYNGAPIPKDVPLSVLSFLFLYAASFALTALALSLTGLDLMTALSGAMTSLSNVGPGMGDIIGPAGNFEPLPDTAKWILSASMLLGRLEIMAALVIFHPVFWRK